jgi:hypothetical protein
VLTHHGEALFLGARLMEYTSLSAWRTWGGNHAWKVVAFAKERLWISPEGNHLRERK